MTAEALRRSRLAVETLLGMDPRRSAEIMREFTEREDVLAEEITALRNDLETESAEKEKWRLRCIAADDAVQAARTEILDLRRHLMTLQTELLRFEEAV